MTNLEKSNYGHWVCVLYARNEFVKDYHEKIIDRQKALNRVLTKEEKKAIYGTLQRKNIKAMFQDVK